MWRGEGERGCDRAGAEADAKGVEARAHLLALKPKTKSIASITFDLPLPLGPTTDVMWRSKGPILMVLAYDLKLVSSSRRIIRYGSGSFGAGCVASSISVMTGVG